MLDTATFGLTGSAPIVKDFRPRPATALLPRVPDEVLAAIDGGLRASDRRELAATSSGIRERLTPVLQDRVSIQFEL